MVARNGAERSGTELRSKIRNGTGLKCGIAKSRNMEGGAVTTDEGYYVWPKVYSSKSVQLPYGSYLGRVYYLCCNCKRMIVASFCGEARRMET